MPEANRNKIDPNWRVTPEAKAIAERLARAAGQPQSQWIEGLIRQAEVDAKRWAMFAERNEHDR